MNLNGHYALCFKVGAFFEAHHKNLNEERPTLSRQRCSPVTLVSGNIRFMGIFARFPGEGHQATVNLSKTAVFSTFARCFFRSFIDKASIII